MWDGMGDRFRLGQPSNVCSHLPDSTPHAIFDQANSCAIYATKPVIDPVMAIAPLAVTEPVKRKLISIIVKNPETCQLMAFVRILNLLSINRPRNGVLCFHRTIANTSIWTLGIFAA